MVDSPLKVKVLSLSGEHMEVACSMDSTVSELKAEITRRTGHLKDLQYLMHEDVALDDKTIIKELGQEEVILTLLVKGLNVEAYIERLRDKGTIERGDLDDLKILCATMRDAFLKQAPLLELEPPLVIGGNLMGSSEQLQHIFDTCGHPPESRYLFLGNYVSVHWSVRLHAVRCFNSETYSVRPIWPVPRVEKYWPTSDDRSPLRRARYRSFV